MTKAILVVPDVEIAAHAVKLARKRLRFPLKAKADLHDLFDKKTRSVRIKKQIWAFGEPYVRVDFRLNRDVTVSWTF